MQTPIVAIVDDDSRVCESLQSLIESTGVRARVFSVAEEFLQEVHLAGTSCLITDVRMPGMDGLDLQRRVRLARPELPIIFITAHHEDNVEQRALAEGASFFIRKPFDVEELLGAIKIALSKSSSCQKKIS